MRTIDLTLPLYPFMPVGNVWAWDSPFQLAPIMTPDSHGVSAYDMSFHSETGTRLMLAACYADDAPKIDELDYARLVNRPAVVIDIPKGALEAIMPEDIDATLAVDPDVRPGDAVLVRTGWGDGERYRRLGDEYATTTPHFSVAGAERLVEVMREKDLDLMLTDCAYVGGHGKGLQYPEWSSRRPWDRPPFPSDQARIYMRHYVGSRGAGGTGPDFPASVPLHASVSPVAALANCGSVTAKRITVTVLPLYLAGAAGAPCTVVAMEE
ncbi:cyclase family protein [Jiangella asiatica]|uniref:cyclase family protein n=1 Tax=Jiangella asiatica TaxID=2530372 RepID=UPI0013A5CF72|nr:cyclase family protein [Jiangella asiatica]